MTEYSELVNDQKELENAKKMIEVGSKLDQLISEKGGMEDINDEEVFNLSLEMIDLLSESMHLFSNLLNSFEYNLLYKKDHISLKSEINSHKGDLKLLKHKSPMWYQIFKDYCDLLKFLYSRDMKLMNQLEFKKFYLDHHQPNSTEYIFMKAYCLYNECTPEYYANIL